MKLAEIHQIIIITTIPCFEHVGGQRARSRFAETKSRRNCFEASTAAATYLLRTSPPFIPSRYLLYLICHQLRFRFPYKAFYCVPAAETQNSS